MYEVLRLYFSLQMEQKQIVIDPPFARSTAKALYDTLKSSVKSHKGCKSLPSGKRIGFA
jgi:hypothetical protein